MSIPSYLKNRLASLEFFLDEIVLHFSSFCGGLQIKDAVQNFKKAGGIFGQFAINKIAILTFLEEIFLEKKKEYSVVEFGSGQSTLFLSEFQNISSKSLKICSFEHDRPWYEKVRERNLNESNIDLIYAGLKTINETARNGLFSDPGKALSLWESQSVDVPEDRYADTRLKNAFYGLSADIVSWLQSIDGLILDGPHGNGRSMAFPLLYEQLHPGTIILIDDYHHYHFLEDLGRVFDYTLINKRKYLFSNNGWAIVRLDNRKYT